MMRVPVELRVVLAVLLGTVSLIVYSYLQSGSAQNDVVDTISDVMGNGNAASKVPRWFSQHARRTAVVMAHRDPYACISDIDIVPYVDDATHAELVDRALAHQQSHGHGSPLTTWVSPFVAAKLLVSHPTALASADAISATPLFGDVLDAVAALDCQGTVGTAPLLSIEIKPPMYKIDTGKAKDNDDANADDDALAAEVDFGVRRAALVAVVNELARVNAGKDRGKYINGPTEELGNAVRATLLDTPGVDTTFLRGNGAPSEAYHMGISCTIRSDRPSFLAASADGCPQCTFVMPDVHQLMKRRMRACAGPLVVWTVDTMEHAAVAVASKAKYIVSNHVAALKAMMTDPAALWRVLPTELRALDAMDNGVGKSIPCCDAPDTELSES